MAPRPKVRLDKDKTGRVDYGLRSVMSSAEVQAILKDCEKSRHKEQALGLKPDPYMPLYALPVTLFEKLKKIHGKRFDRDEKYRQRIVEREFPAFKRTNYRLPITQ